ncbi:ATP-grasp domain-containing protein [Nocardia gipuzkoensis]
MATADSLLFLGIDRYALAACARLGVPAIVVYGPSDGDSKGLSALTPDTPSIFVEDQTSVEAVLGALRRHGYNDRPRSIYTNDERAVVTASVIGGYLGCNNIPLEVAIRFRDKALQKTVVNASVRTAGFTVVEDIASDGSMLRPTGKSVLKPLAGAATASTYIAEPEDFDDVLAELATRRTGCRSFIVEDFIDGEEWVADGIVRGGKLLFVCLGRYERPCVSVVKRRGNIVMWRFDPRADGWAYAEVVPVVSGALGELGLVDGIFHMELFRRGKGDILFSECAVRRGGGLIQEEVLQKTGIDLAENAVRAALRLPPNLTMRVNAAVVGSTFLSSRYEGVLLTCPRSQDIEKLADVVYATVEASPGEIIRNVDSTAVPLGAALIQAGGLNEFHSRAQELQSWFGSQVETVPFDAPRAVLRERDQRRRKVQSSKYEIFVPESGDRNS